MPQHEEHSYFDLAADFIQHTSQHIFLTGKAGTGKTTLLRQIREKSNKNLVVVAPTGVAAINAGGVTMHSFFQLPFGCFIPGSFRGQLHSESAVTDRHHLLRNLRISNQKIELIRNLDLVIIDEVSMLRCDMLDAADTILQHVRRSREPFGGVQMLYIGDLFQLPPVAQEREWALLKDHYASPFFFESHALKQAKPLNIELKKIYRQSDERFIHLLNRVRNNEMEEEDFLKLQKLHQPHFRPNPDDHFITLTTHNYKADEINARELKRLPGKEFVLEATVQGDFSDRIFPAEKMLRLKTGAQIMFIKNDVKEKKYFNGKIGVIAEVSQEEGEEFIKVEFPESKQTITVEKETWSNIRYTFNEAENKIEEEPLGSFTQYPIRLAWAVTIHKSQGLTFQRAVIDAGQAFAAGQVYVALSRCVSLEGIVLLSVINRNAIATDERIIGFTAEQQALEQLKSTLTQEKEAYLLRTTIALFNLQPALEKIKTFIEYIAERQLDEKEKIISGLRVVLEELLKLQDVAQKFQEQLRSITGKGLTDSVQERFTERVNKAKVFFEKELDEKVIGSLYQVNNQLQHQKKVRKVLKEMKTLMDSFDHFVLRYNPDRKKKLIQLNQPPEVSHHEMLPSQASGHLLTLLKQIRRQLASEENAAPYMICHDSGLIEMSNYFPQTINDLAMIKGMGDKSLNKYGDAFLVAIQNFSRMNGLASRMDLKEEDVRRKKLEKKNKPASEGDSKTQTFKLYQEGKTISEIAALRGMAPTTLEGHLAHFVKTGELDVFKFVSKEKFELIKEAMQKTTAPGFGPVKSIIGEAASYSEIRMVFNALDRNKMETSSS